ncbi:MAG: tetratricopeptide repeat protein [Gemmatimonadota bacterium]
MNIGFFASSSLRIIRRCCFALILSLLLASVRSAAAQVPTGDSAWVEGDFVAARTAYQRALATDSTSVRASYRLAIMQSWAGHLDSALALLRHARSVEPDDPDVRFSEAQFLGWNGRYEASIARFDTLLLQHPERRDAVLARAQVLAWANRFAEADSSYSTLLRVNPGDLQAQAGLAQVAAWRGDFTDAVRRYLAVLSHDSTNAEALVGLAQVYHWQGRERAAASYADRALAADSTRRDADEVRAAIRSGIRPTLDAAIGWSRDSDRNQAWWQTIGTSWSLAEGLRPFASAGLLEATDPTRNGTRAAAEIGATYAVGNWQFTGAAGVRRLSPRGTTGATLGTARARVAYAVRAGTWIGLGYARTAFDETAFLLARRLGANTLDLDIESTLRPGTELSAATGWAWIGDGNRRRSALLAASQRVNRHVSVGALGRILGYDFKGVGYFSPDQFSTAEGRAAYRYALPKWDAGVSGGAGAQWVGSHGKAQSQWHIEGRVARKWGAINEVAFSIGTSTSAVSSTTGAFRSSTAVLSARLGL